jgi:hypothetical protein
MACVCYGLRTTKLFRVIKVALRSDAQNASKDGKDEADPDPASAAIMPPEEETHHRNEKGGEQKFDRQVQRRGERDPDEPASAEVDEWHNRADPRLIIHARDKHLTYELHYLSEADYEVVMIRNMSARSKRLTHDGDVLLRKLSNVERQEYCLAGPVLPRTMSSGRIKTCCGVVSVPTR